MSNGKPEIPLLPQWAAFGGYVALMLAVAKAAGDLAPVVSGLVPEPVTKAVVRVPALSRIRRPDGRVRFSRYPGNQRN